MESKQRQMFRSSLKVMITTKRVFMAQTVIKSSPRAVEILAKVRSVKLCVPPSQRETSASVFPVFFAKSRCDIPRSLSSLSNFSAMESEKRNCVFSSVGVSSTICRNSFRPSKSCFIRLQKYKSISKVYFIW